MPGGQFFKTLQIVRQMPEQAIVFPNGPVGGNGHDDGDVIQIPAFHIIRRWPPLYGDVGHNFQV